MTKQNYLFRWILPVLVLLTTISAFAATGLYVEQAKLNDSGTPTGSTGSILLSGDKFRMENDGSIVIGRLDTGVMWYFDTNEHTYFEMPIMPSDSAGSSTKLFYRTGKTRTIGEWKCHEVRMDASKRSGWFEAIDSLTMWISDKSYEQAETYFASIFQAIGVDHDQLKALQSTIGNGFPIEVQLSMLGSTTRLRVTKIDSRPTPSAQFEPLQGYNKQSLENAPALHGKSR